MLKNFSQIYELILGSISSIIDQLEECSEYGIGLVRDMEDAIFDAGLFSNAPDNRNPGIVLLENSLLDVGACTTVAQGVFYMLPLFYEGKLFIR